MTIQELIEQRRSYRSFMPVEISKEIVTRFAKAAQLAPSCFNKQPWRYVFIYEKNALERIKKSLSPGNEWALSSSMIIAVCTQKELDCVMKDGREYYLFDTGMATGFMLLAGTDQGLVVHPIAGYDPQAAKDILKLPEGFGVSVLLIVGKRAEKLNPILKDNQIEAEKTRPPRIDLSQFAFHNEYGKTE